MVVETEGKMKINVCNSHLHNMVSERVMFGQNKTFEFNLSWTENFTVLVNVLQKT